MRYQKESETEILDSKTGLVWRLDHEPGSYTFEEAKSLASRVAKDSGQLWRIPTVDELKSLAECRRRDLALSFPSAPNQAFWSSSQYFGFTEDAWHVIFSDGVVGYGFLTNDCLVRLVREASCEV